MMRRQNPKNKRDQQALLSQEGAPILSDDISESAETDIHNSSSKKKGWRTRLFGGGTGGPRASSTRSVDRAPSTSRTASPAPKKATWHGNKSASVSRLEQQRQAELKGSSSSSTTSRSRSPPRATAPLRTRPEKRDDDPHAKAAFIKTQQAPPPEQSIKTTRSNQGHHRNLIPQLAKSASSQSSTDSHKESNSRPKSAPATSPAAAAAAVIMPSQSRTPKAPPGLVNKVLKRPFGREAVKSQEQMWVVQISPAEWEGDESVWKYRINIQKRNEFGSSEESLQDLTNGLTLRSLADFYWLEQALQSEFHGGLLIPSLSISLGVPDLANCQHEVDARLLTNWLSDVLNGVRGQGEWILKSSSSKTFPVDWQTCEAMEAFMYRTDLNSDGEVPKSPDAKSPRIPSCTPSDNAKWEDGKGGILKWVLTGEMCGLTSACTAPDLTEEATTQASSPHHANKKKINLPLNKQKVSSKALGSAKSFNVEDSFIEPTPTFEIIERQNIAQHANLLRAEKELIWSWRTRALVVMEKLRIVQNEEKHIAASWKRFAISISNLFAYEKEVESVRLGEAKPRKDLQMPYRKLQKSTVDDILRIMAKQKVERSTPSLEVLGVMLSAYVADLSSVQPAVESYLAALRQLGEHNETVNLLKEAKPEQSSASTIADQIQAGLDQVKKQLVSMSDDNTAERTRAVVRLHQAEAQLETMEHQVRQNEEMLQEYLTRLCKTVPVRTARMAFGYIQVETKQTAAMHAAAINMRSRISIASKEALTKMIHRHTIEIKEDRLTELQLVQRMVNLGAVKKFSKTDDGTVEVERGVEINKDMENQKGELRSKAMELCSERIGRWDSKVAMAIMEAVGVEDANVRVEETTRDLRLIRKFAIGLRENVQRCMEALEMLRVSVSQGGFGDIRDLRHDMMWEVQTLFSGIYQPVEQPKVPLDLQVLIDKGISLSDPLGWRRSEDGCGGAAKAYIDMRESGTEWLLNSLGELLKEYNHRVEAVESFVYMECVGIQLEKHFSHQRATALAAFEKKTDITSAINIATRKRMPVLVKELQAKLEAVGADVSHTTVKEAKEAHLESKTLKQELHDLSMRQLARARETSTERAIALMTLWSKEEETASAVELELLKGFAKTLELSISGDELNPYLEACPRF